MLAIAAREAIRDAVASVSGREGEIPLGCPATCEAIFRSIHAMEASSDSGRRLVF
jgi:xanthine dehydrogenase molybdopterin-binding subunit B